MNRKKKQSKKKKTKKNKNTFSAQFKQDFTTKTGTIVEELKRLDNELKKKTI